MVTCTTPPFRAAVRLNSGVRQHKAMTDDTQIAGMTVNERLAHFGLFDAFDSAVKSRNPGAVINVLLRANLSVEQANETAVSVLAAPSYNGVR